jgi:hypothetical protein
LIGIGTFVIGTDYFLFLMFRYRERLRVGDEPKQAMVNAVDRVGEAIASAAGAVIIAFLALVLSTLSFLKQMGPALAIAVAATLVAGLTLIPAVVSLIGPRVFWPSKSWKHEPSDARFAALGRGVQRRPALATAVSGLVLVVLSLGTFGYNATFDLASGSMQRPLPGWRLQRQLLQQAAPVWSPGTYGHLHETGAGQQHHTADDVVGRPRVRPRRQPPSAHHSRATGRLHHRTQLLGTEAL